MEISLNELQISLNELEISTIPLLFLISLIHLMISTIILMISAIHDLVLLSVVVTNCSLGHGLEVRVSEHYLRNTHFVQDGERAFQNKFKIMVSPAY